MHDDEASADDAATSCAMLLASTSEREGALATEEVMDIVRDSFGARGERHKTTAVAFLKLEYERAIDRGQYGAARRAARRARALVGFGDGADAELDFESRRMNANLDRVMQNFDAAQDELRTIIKEAELCGDEHAVMRATLTLAETHLSADAPTLALTRALPLERLAAERGLEPIRATVTCIACEAWLALGGSHARLARDTLDERSLALLSSDCLRTQARAYAACARARRHDARMRISHHRSSRRRRFGARVRALRQIRRAVRRRARVRVARRRALARGERRDRERRRRAAMSRVRDRVHRRDADARRRVLRNLGLCCSTTVLR